jgi:hypothetical protein
MSGLNGFVRLHDNTGLEVANGTSPVAFDCTNTGEYLLTATSRSVFFSLEQTGSFTLIILKKHKQ